MRIVEDFLSLLGEVKKNDPSTDGFSVTCQKCGSNDCVFYDETGSSDYTGGWGDAGIKCKDCGNAAEVYHA